jgi:hypothetical protein
VHFIGDLELGIGAGVGGNDNTSGASYYQADGLDWNQRVAWGGYQGIGFGGQINWFSIYVRARIEESTAATLPLTLWPSASVGLEANILQRASIGVAGGYLGYTNAKDTENGWFYQIGVTVFLDAFKRHDAHAEPAHVDPPAARPEPTTVEVERDEPKPEED